MTQHRHRQRKVKREHTIIEGLWPLLQKAGKLDVVSSITPGRIRRRARSGGDTGLFYQYTIETGLKLLGRSTTSVQEVFVVTPDPEAALEALIRHGIVHPVKSPRPSPGAGGSESSRSSGGTRGATSSLPAPRTKRSESSRRPSPAGEPESLSRSRSRSRPSPPAGEPAPARESMPPSQSASTQGSPPAKQAAPVQDAPPQKSVDPDSPEAQKVEPKLWNDLLRLHQELWELEKSLEEAFGHVPPPWEGPGDR